MTNQKKTYSPNGSSADRRRQKRAQQRFPFAPEEEQPAKAQNEKDETRNLNQEKDEDKDMSDEWWKRVFGSSAVWTAIFTAVLCVFTGILAWISFQDNRLNQANQRAMLNFNGPGLQKKMSPDGKKIASWQVYYGWTNSGRDPAKNAFAQYNFSLGDKRPTRDLNFDTLPTRDTYPMILGPNTSFGMTPVELTIPDLEDVESGKKHLFFWGWATYSDGIPGSPRRLTEFCTDVTGLTWSADNHSDPSTTPVVSTPPCEKHNCYDEDCEDYRQRTSTE